ncbi:uncharacterized protein LOC108247487 [Kryptolebias marmoratus]|uniref:uncharacterized protein LOC108247487 n=1 Tax=Kryptolebias marmoratus TaxID=37003 RepID=UPI0007F930F8|nr:uncharacterized protein LOC108247487 [Kryptolebias marmoratus]
MKMDSDNEINFPRSSTECFYERPQDETSTYSAAPALIQDNEGPDDVFTQSNPPPSTCEASLLPSEGDTDTTASNSGMTLLNGAADASSTKANPNSLDSYHGEKQLMTEQDRMDKVIPSTTQSSRESLDNNDKNFTSTAYQDQTSMEDTTCPVETCYDKPGKLSEDSRSEDEESNEDSEDIILSESEENCGENQRNRGSVSQQIYPNADENSETEICPDKEGDKTNYENICCFDEKDSKISRDQLDTESVEINASTLPGPSANKDKSESPEPSEFFKFNQNMPEEATNQPQVDDFSGEVTTGNVEHVDESLDYKLTKFDSLKREHGVAGTQITHLPFCDDSDEMVEQADRSQRTSIDIQQGEQLLHRLQMVQLRHNEIPNILQEISKDVRVEEHVRFRPNIEEERLREESMTSEEEEEGYELNTVKEEEATTNWTDNKNGEQVQTKVKTCLSTMAENNQINNKKEGECLDNENECSGPSDFSLDNIQGTSCSELPFISTGHRFSAVETFKERRIHEATQGKQNLQRAEGLFNLADNSDVLEIPFKTNLSLESLLTNVCTSQPSPWQFSEKKMQKEISQEIQRELVLVNQGKIPGGYSRGEVRQLKETKLMFEAFQQDKTKAPTRHQKHPASVMKGDVYPSVLERTRSLEMFSLKTCSVSRTQSLKVVNSETTKSDKNPENLRSKSPTGGSREKSRSSPYSKQDKHLRLHRSMDSISSEACASAVKTRDKTKEGGSRQESPILKQNPFFKLRPAMSLQPEVEKDIREAKEREEELQKQRCKLYGEFRQKSEDEEKSRGTQTFRSDVRLQSRRKLERVWPPPSKKDQKKSEQTQQEVKVHRAGGQRAPLWQRWESGLINEPAQNENK